MGRAAARRPGVILLDTNAVIWTVNGDARLGRVARATIVESDDRRYSAMVQWEMAMLEGRGRLLFAPTLDQWIDRATVMLDLAEVAITGAIAKEAGSLRDGLHGDPCDRIMIATARMLGCPLVTSDEKILDYAVRGHLKAIDARR